MYKMYGTSSLYGDGSIYFNPGYQGSFENTYQFDYLPGTTVLVTLDVAYTLGSCCKLMLYAGETTASYVEIQPGVETPITFESTISGLTNLYVKMVLFSYQPDTSPEVTSLTITIKQRTSLYTVAVQVLTDGLSGTGISYSVDRWLENILLDYSWLNPQKHRSALAKIAEAAGGVCYQDREGNIKLISSNTIKNAGAIVETIGQDKIYDSQTPVSSVYNTINVTTNPYQALTDQTVWTLIGDTAIDNLESRTFKVFFTDHEAVIDAYAVLNSTPAGATIDSETWYTWGGSVTVIGSSDGQELDLTVSGKPLALVGQQVVESIDSDSIKRNGSRYLSIEDNRLIQGVEQAQLISDAIRDITADERRDVVLNWRGNPALELGDVVDADTVEGVIVENEINFDGMLTSITRVRKK